MFKSRSLLSSTQKIVKRTTGLTGLQVYILSLNHNLGCQRMERSSNRLIWSNIR